ncbi:MAG: hypothetical protein JO164_00155, partial [Candidatus Eremiobacteraeota bacterium]|nr:hypothetical protein [Candidatus Eremiobacteraeota bacterium]
VYPQVRIELDDVDPLLAGAANRAIAAASTDLIVLVADDVLLPAGALDRMRSAFARIPALGAAFPAVPGGVGGEGIGDVGYADVAELRTLAERRAISFARQSEPIEIGAAPALVVARAAFEAVGGIDPSLGPTRRGIADLTQRLRAAGYALARCDDALAHRFGIDVTRSPLAAADAQQPVPAADLAAVARGFDPARRVPFVRAVGAVATAPNLAVATSHAIVVAVAGVAELERAAVFVAAAARAFDASAPVRVHLILDGAIGSAEAAARLRSVLADASRPIEETVAVRIERVADLVAWRAALESEARIVVAAGHDREALTGLAVVAADGLRGVLREGSR